jgi:hypothetical protein
VRQIRHRHRRTLCLGLTAGGVICETPSGYALGVRSATQGALCGFAAARPWAAQYNAFGVGNVRWAWCCYREAVIFQSPGSRERTLGHGAIPPGHTPKALYNGKMIGPTICPIRRRRLTIARVSSHFTAVSSRNRRLCHFSNPFGVCPSCAVPDPGCALRLRRGATLGCAVQRLRRRNRSFSLL